MVIQIDFLEVGKGGKESFLPRVPIPGKKGEASKAEERRICLPTENVGLLAEKDLVTDVERTNNRAERDLREPIVIRKIIGTLRNEKGTRVFETVMTMLATWKRQGLNPREEMLKAVRT